jgi:hypothetical protein
MTNFTCIPVTTSQGTLLSSDKNYYSVAQFKFSSAKSIDDVRSHLDPIATSQNMIVGYHICVDSTSGRYLEGALLFDAKQIQDAPKSVFPPTASDLFGADENVTLRWNSPNPKEKNDGLWNGTGAPLTTVASVAANKGWKGWQAYYCPLSPSPSTSISPSPEEDGEVQITGYQPTQLDYNLFVSNLEAVNSGFHTLYNSPVAMESFYTGGKDEFLICMQAALRMNAMDPEEVKSKLLSEAQEDYDKLDALAKKLRNEKFAASASSTTAAMTSWIPFVGVAVGFADIGVEIGLYFEEKKVENEIDQLLDGDRDTSSWLHSFPDIQQGLSLITFLVRNIGKKDSADPNDVAAATISSLLMNYLQTHMVMGGDVPTIDELDQDLQQLGNDSVTGDEMSNILDAINEAAQESTESVDAINLDRGIWDQLRYASWAIRGAKPFLLYVKRRISKYLFGWIGETVDEAMQCAFTEEDVLIGLGVMEESAMAAQDSDEAAQVIARAATATRTEAKWYTQVREASFSQASRMQKAIAVIGVLAGITEFALAQVEFDNLEEQFEEIHDARKKFADQISNYWFQEVKN